MSHQSSSRISKIIPRMTWRFCPEEFAGKRDLIFRNLFILKLVYASVVSNLMMMLETNLFSGKFFSVLSIGIILAAGAMVFKQRFLYLGLLIFALKAASLVWQTFPYTINHHFLELVIVILLLLLTPIKNLQAEKDMTVLRVHYIGLLYLSVWIYSGIHKIVQDYFPSGEFMALYSLSGVNDLGENLQRATKTLHAFFDPSTGASLIPACCNAVPLSIPSWEMWLYRVSGWPIILMEIVFPLMIFFPAWKMVGLYGIILAQIGITLSSAELDFGMTCVSMISLLAPSSFKNFLYALSGVLYAVDFYPLYLYLKEM